MTCTTEKPISLSRNNSRASGKFTTLKPMSTAVTRQYRRGNVRTPAHIDCRCAPGTGRPRSRTKNMSATLRTAGTIATYSRGLIWWSSSS